MLNPSWNAIGIARACKGGNCAWVTDFGVSNTSEFTPAALPDPVRLADLMVTAVTPSVTGSSVTGDVHRGQSGECRRRE